jgi:hypothetical protein
MSPPAFVAAALRRAAGGVPPSPPGAAPLFDEPAKTGAVERDVYAFLTTNAAPDGDVAVNARQHDPLR